MINTTDAETRPKEIDIPMALTMLWRRRKLIVLGTLAATLLVAILSFLIPRSYASEGFYQLGNPDKNATRATEETPEIGLPIPLFKKSVPEFFNPNRIARFAESWQTFNKEDLGRIKARFRTTDAIKAFIAPVYVYSKADTRELVQLPKNESNTVLGLMLNFNAKSKQQAYDGARFLGHFVRDCLMYVTLFDFIKNGYSNSISSLSANENQILEISFQIVQNTKKMSDIKDILTKYPEAQRMESRQVISVQEGGFRFLGPVTQLVGIESALADERRVLAELQRTKEMLGIEREFFMACNDVLNRSNRSGGRLFQDIKGLISSIFNKKDFRRDTVKEVFNKLQIKQQMFDLAFFTDCRFLSGPTYPERHSSPRRVQLIVLGGMLSFLFLVCLAFGLAWWQANKLSILSGERE